MLYVFYVDLGIRLPFDMSLVNERVVRLKHAIEERSGIPVNKQILLVSGGACLDDSAKVCNYPAGTDTNPIYLFNRTHLETGKLSYCGDIEFLPQTPPDSDSDLNKLYESVVNSTAPAAMYTINKLSSLAQKYMERAVNIKTYCDQLNSDLSLQQQGLAVAVANLDDVLGNFKNQCESFDAAYNRYLESRDKYLELIERCSEEDLKLLSQIPLLPALLDGNDEERSRLGGCGEQSDFSRLTLLNWIAAKDPQQSLEDVVQSCKDALLKYDKKQLEGFRTDVDALFHPDRFREHHDHSRNSEVSKKLIIVSGLLVTIEEKCDDQKKQAYSVKQNYERATELKEDSILPDLLLFHHNTLKQMKNNQMKLRSSKDLCDQVKNEFCKLVSQRLRDILKIQEHTAEMQTALRVHLGFLKRTRAYMQVIEQLHTTPKNYLAAVSEVVRRRSYSQAFLMWASDVACRLYTVYTDEVERRKKFLAEFDGHFLACLFPGLQDMPPNFATQSPPLFDNLLPALCGDDLKWLCDTLPQLKDDVVMPNIEWIRNFFLSKSLNLGQSEDAEDRDEKVEPRSKVSEQKAPASTDDKSSSSSSPSSSSSFANKEPSAAQGVTTSSDSQYGTPSGGTTMNDSSMQIEKISHERNLLSMEQVMAVLGCITSNTVILMRKDISELRSWVSVQQSEIGNMLENLHEQTRSQAERIEDMKETLASKDEQIKNLLAKISEMEADKMERETTTQEMLDKLTAQHEKSEKLLEENLTNKHKQAMEALTQRYKLINKQDIERYPSDTSLEKVEGSNVIDLAKHEQMIAQLRMNMEMEMTDALEREKTSHRRELIELEEKTVAEKMLLEKTVRDSLTEEHRKKIENVCTVMQDQRETIRLLTSMPGEKNMLNRIRELEDDKRALERELIEERQSNYSTNSISQCASTSMMSAGSSADRGPTSLASNPELFESKDQLEEWSIKKKKSRLSNSSTVQKLSSQKCETGDLVLVVWDEAQKHYTILQESKTVHFLHPQSYEALGLQSDPDGKPKANCVGEVIMKETCRPKRKSNRYNLEKGETFIRVKVKPLKKPTVIQTNTSD